MFFAKTLSFYKKREVQEALVEHAEHKEISIQYQTYFGKRPDALYAEGDVMELAKKKASSFHASEELWSNPLAIKTGMTKKEIQELRIGWDLILDIDCPYWPLSKLITHLFIKALKAHDINAVTVKFSGNKGFHIAVPFESFPTRFNGQATKDLFPEAPRRIALYLLHYLSKNYVKDEGAHLLFDKKYRKEKKKLAKDMGLDSTESFTKLHYYQDGKEISEEQAKKSLNKKRFLVCPNHNCGFTEPLIQESEVYTCKRCNSIMSVLDPRREDGTINEIYEFDPFTVIEVDTILIAHRHLYRMPYSFHEKSEKVSVPILAKEVLGLKSTKEWAEADRVNFSVPFLDRNAAREGEATKLLTEAFDFNPNIDDEENQEKKEYTIPEEALPEDFFPPCIKAMLAGLKDGRKRALFTLINFLRGSGWSIEQIEDTIIDWNKRNEEPLREVEIKGRIRYEKTKKEPLPPHNCKRYYQDFGVCKPDEFCDRVKNPLQYAKRKANAAGFGVDAKPKREKLSDEQKEMRKKHREKMKIKKEQK